MDAVRIAKVRMQEAIKTKEDWAETWKVQINKNKMNMMLFSLCTKPQN